MRRYSIVLLCYVTLLFFFGCSQNTVKEDSTSQKNEQTQTANVQTAGDNQAPVNPHGSDMQPKQPKQIIVPDSVAKKFKAVNINITDKKTDKVIPVKAKIGEKTSVPNTDIVIFVEAYLPDFTMGTENITSASDEEKNPAVKVAIERKDNKVEGWLFKNFDIHKIEDPDYDYALIGGAN